MGVGSSTKSGDVDKRNQELIDKYWSLKESIEERTVKFLRCVDILESASIHIVSGNEKTKDRDIELACDPITRKLLRTSKVLEEGERRMFVDGVVTFVEFVSQSVQSELQTDNVQRDVACNILRTYKSIDEIEDKKDAGDLKKIFENFQLQIKTLDKLNETLKKENGVLQSLVNSLEKSNEEYTKLNHTNRQEIEKLTNELENCEKKNKSKNASEVLELQNELTNEKNKRENITKNKNREIEGLKKSVEALEEEIQLKRDEISRLNNLLENNRALIEKSMSVHEKETKKRDYECNEHKTKISKLSTEVADLKKDIANLLQNHEKELNNVFDEKAVAESRWKEELHKLEEKNNKANNEIDRLRKVFDASSETFEQTNAVLKQELGQQKLDFNRCDKEKRELEKALNETRLRSEKKNEEAEKRFNQVVRELENSVKNENELKTKLKKSDENFEMCSKEKEKAENQILSLQSKHRTVEMKHRNEILELNSKLSTLEKQRNNLKQDLQNHCSENEALKDELKKMKMKKILKVNLFSVRRPNTLADFEDAVIAMLKSKIDDNIRNLTFEQQNNPDVVNIDTDPTIVLCFCGSRIGTDAEKAVEGLNLSPKKALVMIHHKDIHALPQQLSDRVIIGQEFKKLDCITDMAFLRDKGIFPCEINNNSLVKLVNFIKQKGIEYNKY